MLYEEKNNTDTHKVFKQYSFNPHTCIKSDQNKMQQNKSEHAKKATTNEHCQKEIMNIGAIILSKIYISII